MVGAGTKAVLVVLARVAADAVGDEARVGPDALHALQLLRRAAREEGAGVTAVSDGGRGCGELSEREGETGMEGRGWGGEG